MKKLIAGLSAMVFVLAMTGVASAATISNINDDSSATTLAQWIVKVFVHNTNTASIDNNVTASASTGNNTVTSADDQEGTVISTGNSAAAVVVDNSANNNTVKENLDSANGAGGTIDSVNDESTASSTFEDKLCNDITNDNSVTVANDLSSDATTGDNTVNSQDSLKDTKVTTGTTDSAVGITNTFNVNVKEIVRTLRSLIQ